MATELANLVVRISGDASDLNTSLKETFQQTKAATAGFKELGKFAFKLGAILGAFGGGVLLFLKSSLDTFLEAVGDPALQDALLDLEALINEIQVTLASEIAPILTDVLEKIVGVVKKFKDENPGLFKDLVLLGAALGVVAAFASAVLLLFGALASSAATLGLTAGVIGTFLAALAPFLLVIGLILIAWKTGFLDLEVLFTNSFNSLSLIAQGFGKLLQGDMSGLMDIVLGIFKLGFGNATILLTTFMARWFSLFIDLQKGTINMAFGLIKWVIQIIGDGFNKVASIAEGFINGLITAWNSVAATLKLPTLGTVSIGKVDVGGALSSLEQGRQQAFSNLDTQRSAVNKGAQVTQNVAVNIETAFVDTDKKVEELANKVGEVLANQINNRAGLSPLTVG